MGKKVILRDVRISYPALHEKAAPYEAGQKEKYQATFLVLKKSALDIEINKAIREVAVEAWGGKAEAQLAGIRGNNMKYCFNDGDLKDTDGYAGHFYLTAKADVQPLIIDKDKTPLSPATGRPYGGCYVIAHVEIYAQKRNGNAIRASLKGVQFFRDGDAFAGGVAANADDFEDLSEGADEALA